AGDPTRAASLADQLGSRAVQNNELPLLDKAAKDWLQARDQADRGEFNMATLTIDRIRRLLPELGGLERFQQELARRKESFAAQLVHLHEAVDQKHWRKVVELADQILALAPQHAQARKARAQAWKAIEPSTVGFHPGNGEALPKQTAAASVNGARI